MRLVQTRLELIMRTFHWSRWTVLIGIVFAFVLLNARAQQPEQDAALPFEPLFNGKDLNGWFHSPQIGRGYVVENGLLVCPADGGGNLLSEQEYTDFVLRFQFRLSEGANSGIAIRTPRDGDPAFLGMEIQILDESARNAARPPQQQHGAIFDVAPAKRGALKPAGEWNRQEIACVGRQVRVTLNDTVILETNINLVTDRLTLQKHPGLLRDRGHIGFIGSGSRVEFRKIEIQRVAMAQADNEPPPGFIALLNGKDLSGWKGLPPEPPKRFEMSAADLAAAQAKADELMRKHWQVRDGALVYTGNGFDNLVTVEEYGDFELLISWKIEPKGDSGLYLRGTPQVQIWDNPEGSGALWNNKRNPNKPLVVADRSVGEWNRFRILMLGEKVTVYLNHQLVVHNVTMENYWESHKPVYPMGPIELQAHRDEVWFKNAYVREIPRQSN